jgi:hypothetical protein
VLQDAGLEHANIPSTAGFAEFVAQAAFAKAGFADNADDSRLALHDARQLGLEHREFLVAPGEWGRSRSASEVLARRRAPQPGQFENLDRCGKAADGLRPKRACFDKLLGRGEGVGGQQDRPVFGHLLHAICQMHVGAGDIVGLLEIVKDHFAGVQAHANPDLRIAEAHNRFLHGEASQTPAHRMIFMRFGSAKKRHDPVPLRLADDPFVPIDRLFHGIEHRLQAQHARFRIHALDEAGRIADICEENGDVLALSGTGAGGGDQVFRRLIDFDRSTAAAAKPAVRPVRVAANAASSVEWRPTSVAIRVARSILPAATPTLHLS